MKTTKKTSCPMGRRRMMVSMLMGTAFGFLCSYLASATAADGFWWSPLMWTIVTDRMLIGLTVGIAGAYLIHPIFRFKMSPWFRGSCLGAFVSLPLATGAMMSPVVGHTAWELFGLTMLAGATYGLIIDLVATKFVGQGPELLD